MSTIIQVVLGAIIGLVMGYSGFDVSTWQFWVVLLSAIGMYLNGAYQN